MANYLVTGGAGFIGSHIVEHLVGQGEHVRVVDNFSTGKRENLAPLLKKITLLEGSLTDFEVCLKAVDGIDFVFHEAAIPSVPRSVKDPITSNEANVTATVNLLFAAHKKKVRRVIYAASSSAYGNKATLPKSEDQAPAPLSPYAVSKLAGEHYCAAFSNVYELETISLRYFNVFGPRQDPTSQYAAVIPRFITTMMANLCPPVFGDGTQTRDFSFVANNVHANMLATKVKKTNGEVINIACGEKYSLIDLIDFINEILGKDMKAEFLPDRSGDVKHSLAALKLAKEVIDYEPVVGFKEGLKRTLEWFMSKSK